MNEKVTAVQVGIGGYGRTYLDAMLKKNHADFPRLIAAVEPNPRGPEFLAEFGGGDIPIYPSLEAFYQAGGAADLTIVVSPIHLHRPQTCTALAHGSHVLCEKPVAPTPADVQAMIQARDAAQRQVAVGYQWCYSQPIQTLKRDLLDGVYGRPLRFKTQVLWPRDLAYYGRSPWAGAKKIQGVPVWDSPVNNATAHYLQNMLYLLGATPEAAAFPLRVQAELSRANAIENYDSAALRIELAGGVELLFFSSHTVEKQHGPEFELVCEKGRIHFCQDHGAVIYGEAPDGAREYAWTPDDDWRKLSAMVEVIRGEKETLCGLEAALPHVLCVAAAQESAPEIIEIPEAMKVREETPAPRIFVRGQFELLQRCYEQEKLPGELGFAPSIPGRIIDVSG